MKTKDMEIMDTNVQINISELKSKVQNMENTNTKMGCSSLL
jgi:hypothetical protein